jgi:hypothetical protein
VVDGETVSSGSANSAQDEFQVLLGGTGGLKAGEHVAVLVNDGIGPIDLDMLMFETWTRLGHHGYARVPTPCPYLSLMGFAFLFLCALLARLARPKMVPSLLRASRWSQIRSPAGNAILRRPHSEHHVLQSTT